MPERRPPLAVSEQPAHPEPLLDAKTIAGWLGVSLDQVYRLAKRGDLPSLMIGRSRRFRRSDVDSLLAKAAADEAAAVAARLRSTKAPWSR